MKKFLKSVNEHKKYKEDFIESKRREIIRLEELRKPKELSLKEKDIEFNKTFNEEILHDIENLKLEIKEMDKKIEFVRYARDKAENMKFSYDCQKSATSIDDILEEADLKSKEDELCLAKKAYLEACNAYSDALQYIHEYKIKIRDLDNTGAVDKDTVKYLRNLFARHFMFYIRPADGLNMGELNRVNSRIDSLLLDIKRG